MLEGCEVVKSCEVLEVHSGKEMLPTRQYVSIPHPPRQIQDMGYGAERQHLCIHATVPFLIGVCRHPMKKIRFSAVQWPPKCADALYASTVAHPNSRALRQAALASIYITHPHPQIIIGYGICRHYPSFPRPSVGYRLWDLVCRASVCM